MDEEYWRELLADRSLDVIDSVPKFEEVLRKHKKSIAENINVMSMLMNPCSFNNIISEKKQEEIRKIYSNKGSLKAAERFVGAILRSKDETKWSVFKEALQRSEGNELIKDILCHGVTESLIVHENNKRQIILQRGSIAEKWHTEHIYEALRQEQLLTSQEYEEVQAMHHNQGSKAASYHILTVVPRRKDFLPKLLKILYDLGYRQSVKEVDVDFFRKMEERGDFKDCSEKLDTSDHDDDNANESVDNNVPGDEETCTNAVGRNYMEHSLFPIGDDNMALNICTGLLNDEKVTNTVKMMNDSSINNLNLPDNDDPIASRTRSKTKLRQMKQPGASTLNEPVFEHSQPLTPKRPTGTLDRQTVTSHSQTEARHKARETSLVEQTAVQRPKYNSLDLSRKYAQSKDTAMQVSLNEFSTETEREANLTTCECGEWFICLDELRQHQSTKCKVTVGCSTKQQCQLLLVRDGHVAHGARFETERLPATGFDEYFLQQRVVESRQPGTSCTPIETLPAAQNVVQLPGSDISKKSTPGKGAAATEVRFQVDNRQTTHGVKFVTCVCEKRFVSKDDLRKHQNSDCQVKVGRYQDIKCELGRGAPTGTGLQEGSQQTHQKVTFLSCISNEQLIPKDTWRKHQSTDCQEKLSKQAEPCKDAGTSASLQEGKQTNQKANLVTCACGKRFISEDTLKKHQSVDCQVKLGHYRDNQYVAEKQEANPIVLQEDNKPIQDKVKARQEEVIASKPELKFNNETAKGDQNKCPKCGNRFQSQERLQRHIGFSCRAMQNQAVWEETLPKSFYEEHSPMAKTTSKQANIQSDHSNASNSMKPNRSETTERKSDHHIAMQKSPQVTRQQNAQGREISPIVTMRTLRNSNSGDPEKSAQTKSGTHNSNQTSSLTEHPQRSITHNSNQTSSLTEHFQRSSTHNSNQTSSLTEHSQRSSTDSFSSSAHSNESLGSNSNQDTVESNDRSQSQISNTDGRETPPNRRQNNRRQEEPSAGGFGFQSTRTLRLKGPLDLIDSIIKLEEALKKHRYHIVRNLNVMSMLINDFSFTDIISEDKQGKIKSCYGRREINTAAEMFIDAILHSKDPTKLSVFKDALVKSEGNEIVIDILSEGETEYITKHENRQKQVLLQQGRIVKQWHTELVYEKCRQKQLLTTTEFEEVRAMNRTQSDPETNVHILTLVIRKKNFFSKLLNVLNDLGYKRCLKLLDSHFCRKKETDCPERLDTSDFNTDNVHDDNTACTDAIGINSLEYYSCHSGDGNMFLNICPGFMNNDTETNTVKMINTTTTSDLNLPEDESPIASRTRSKTGLREMNRFDESIREQSALGNNQTLTPHRKTATSHRQAGSPHRQAGSPHRQAGSPHRQAGSPHRQAGSLHRKAGSPHRQAGSPHRQTRVPQKDRESSSPEQTVMQRPRSDSLDSSNNHGHCKNTATLVSLHEDGRQTENKANLTACAFEKLLVCPDEIKTHQGTDNEVTRGFNTENQCQLLFGADAAIASGARCKTGLLQTADPKKINAKHPMVKPRQAGASCTPRETFQPAPTVNHLRRSDSFDASKKFLTSEDCKLNLGPHKNADSSESLTLARQEEAIASKPKHKLDEETAKGNRNKCSKCGIHFISLDRLQRHIAFSCRGMQNQTVSEEALRIHQNTDCTLNLGPHKNTDSSESLTSARPEEAIASKPKLKFDNETAKGDRKRCPKCGIKFTSQERLHRHIGFSCRAMQNQAVSEETLPKSFYEEHSPVAKTKSKQPMVLQEDNKPIQDKAKARQEEAIASKPKPKFDNETAKGDRNKCPKCGNRFISQERLQRHIEFNCKATQNQTVSKETLPKSFYEEHSPMAKAKSKQGDIQSDHSNAGNSMKPNRSETEGKSDHHIAVQQQQNAQGRETPQNRRQTNRRQEEPEAGGFGFQSTRTLRLNKDR